MDPALRPMTTAKLLDRTFHLYLKHFGLFTAIAFPASAIDLLYSLAQNAFLLPYMTAVRNEGLAAIWSTNLMINFVFPLLASCLSYALASSATVQAVSAVHLGRSASAFGCYSVVRSKLSKVLKTAGGSYFLAFWPILLGLALFVAAYAVLPSLIIGGHAQSSALLIGVALVLLAGSLWCIFALLRYSLAVAAATVEDGSISNALSRSKILTKGNLRRVLLIYLLAVSFAVALDFILQAPLYLVHDGTFTGNSGIPLGKWQIALGCFLDFLTGVLAGPVATIAFAVLYYDQRVRQEAFDLELMMDAMEEPNNPSQAAAQAGPH